MILMSPLDSPAEAGIPEPIHTNELYSNQNCYNAGQSSLTVNPGSTNGLQFVAAVVDSLLYIVALGLSCKGTWLLFSRSKRPKYFSYAHLVPPLMSRLR
ncbi:hypothetical protein Pint_27273 [Pistacia integerrima]|uniref:Uncharacterized protein n=1 Tax=Pistacia integerrima TaxID=434235 RepID=A0ACC0YNK7_9ROSI|nr:hypothetical protein Pint_27273 [Pistacia integerrima]